MASATLEVKQGHVRQSSGANETVRVMVRFRPINSSEKAKANKIEPWRSLQATDKGCRIDSSGTNLKIYNIEEHGHANGHANINFKSKIDKFTFDAVMGSDTTQDQAFQRVAQQICDEIVQGYNSTIFVYGQSGSGKTHTMYGPEEKKDSVELIEMGVIPRSCGYIFNILNNPDHPLVKGMDSYVVQCEFLEIYNNTLRDLLNPQNSPEIRERPIPKTKDEWKVEVTNIETRQVSNLGEILKSIRDASKNRTVAKTNLNATSSRSHMIMRLIVKITTKNDGERTGIGNFADLAGSEKVKKTGARGQQLREAQGILSSLSTLAAVIDALVHKKLPPYKDSKLTFALKDSLGGNSKTALLIACSPHVFNRTETVNSLKFGRRCRRIQNKAKLNIKMTRSQLEKENARLLEEIERLRGGAGLNIPKSSRKQPAVDPEVLTQMQKEKEQLMEEINQLKAMNDKFSDQLAERDRIQAENEQKQQDYDELLERIKAKEEELEAEREMLAEMEADRDLISQQRDDLSVVHKQLTQSEAQLQVEKDRLLHANEKQSEELNKWKKEVDLMKESQSALQAKWSAEFESKKSQFSQQELEMSKQIESMQVTIDEDKQYRAATQRELKLNQETLQQRQDRIHELEDELRALRALLEEEKAQHAETRAENERLRNEIEMLKSQLRTEKLKSEKVEAQHNAELDDLGMKINDMEVQIETKSTKVLELEHRLEAMQRKHAVEVDTVRMEVQSLRDLNVRLQEENQTAVDLKDEHRAQAERQRETLSSVQTEKDIIAKQLEQLQSHYRSVIQKQIEDDEAYARELEQQELEYARKMEAEARRNGKKKGFGKNRKGKHGLHGDTPMGPVVGSDTELSPLAGGSTPMGPVGSPQSPTFDLMHLEYQSEPDGDSEEKESSTDFDEEDEDEFFDQDEQEQFMMNRIINVKRTQSGLLSMGAAYEEDDHDDDEHRRSAFKEYADNIPLQPKMVPAYSVDSLHAKERKEQMKRGMHKKQDSIPVMGLGNDDIRTPKGNKKRDTIHVISMRDRGLLQGKHAQFLEEDEDELLIEE